jgi:hypothetical protein
MLVIICLFYLKKKCERARAHTHTHTHTHTQAHVCPRAIRARVRELVEGLLQKEVKKLHKLPVRRLPGTGGQRRRCPTSRGKFRLSHAGFGFGQGTSWNICLRGSEKTASGAVSLLCERERERESVCVFVCVSDMLRCISTKNM